MRHPLPPLVSRPLGSTQPHLLWLLSTPYSPVQTKVFPSSPHLAFEQSVSAHLICPVPNLTHIRWFLAKMLNQLLPHRQEPSNIVRGVWDNLPLRFCHQRQKQDKLQIKIVDWVYGEKKKTPPFHLHKKWHMLRQRLGNASKPENSPNNSAYWSSRTQRLSASGRLTQPGCPLPIRPSCSHQPSRPGSSRGQECFHPSSAKPSPALCAPRTCTKVSRISP